MRMAASEAIQTCAVTPQLEAGVVKIGACVFVKRKGLRHCPKVSPIPFSYGPMIAKIMSRHRFNTDFNESRDDIFVRIRTTADD